ncbi:transposable element Tc1 transposase [Trichonephila clavipes]|nr:transposable element Tc1 transposase [Trichonephila clavipes]
MILEGELQLIFSLLSHPGTENSFALDTHSPISFRLAKFYIETDFSILNPGQVTRTTSELASSSPNYHTIPTGGLLASTECAPAPLHGGSSVVLGLELMTRLFKKGKSYREIAKIVGRSHSCVQKIIGRFKSDGLIENKSGRGSKSILSDVAKRKVLKDIKIDPKPSAVKLAAETSRIMGRSVSAETVRNVIRHAGHSSRVATKKPFIILQNQKKHLEFAKTHQLKTDNFWKKVIFSDESKFNIFGSDGRRTVWRKPNTALDPKNLRPTVKQGGGSVMVWGLRQRDSKYTARNVKMWYLFHCKQQLHTPPQSPDINVIENLWTTLEIVVQKHQIRNKSHLKQVLQEEWDKISPDTTKKLVESVPRRLEDIIKAKGHHAARY